MQNYIVHDSLDRNQENGTPLFSEVPESSCSFFDNNEETLEQKIYYNDIWRKSIEERQNRPLTINEYEKWYETAANCELNSELQYVKYVRDYHNNYKGTRLLHGGEPYKENPEQTLSFPTLMCTSEQMMSKLAATTEECNKLKRENERYKEMLGNFCENYAHSPERKSTNENLVCPKKPTRKRSDKFVRFDHSSATPRNLFPVKSQNHFIKPSSPTTSHGNEEDPRRLRRQLTTNNYQYVKNRYRKEPHPLFVKASDLMKRIEDPKISIDVSSVVYNEEGEEGEEIL